jgi:uncharacterized protein involved in response to NO
MQIVDTSRALAVAPLWRLGFRPFFLGGSVFALLAIPLWLLALADGAGGWTPAGDWLAWHRHEMLFGFGAAIIAGFLLTAVQTWTGRPGLSGRPLAVLAGLWLAARLAWVAGAPHWLLLPLELAFLPAVAVVLGRTLWSVRQVRNYPVVAVLLLMTLANALVMTGVATADEALQRRGAMSGLWVIVTLLGLIGGRVIPFFTQRGLDLKKGPTPLPWMDGIVLVGGMGMVLLTAAGATELPHAAYAVFCFQLAAGHLLRLAHWYDHGIWRVPLLWSLHLAYAWLVVAIIGFGLWHAGTVTNLGPPLHALTVGAMGGAILAMLARVTLGHTGRPLQPPSAMRVAFVLLHLGVLLRVGLVYVWPTPALQLAGICWALAFAIFVRHYAPMLWSARVDGHPG